MDDRPGCIGGLLRLFFLNTIYDWMQDRFGFGRGGCFGCGCGCIMLVIFVMMFFSILFGTNWFEFRLMIPNILFG
jgi:hypothetical protein